MTPDEEDQLRWAVSDKELFRAMALDYKARWVAAEERAQTAEIEAQCLRLEMEMIGEKV